MPKRRHEPRRTCVACRQEGSKDELIRLVRSGEAVAVDPTGRAPGRGAASPQSDAPASCALSFSPAMIALEGASIIVMFRPS